MIRKFLKRFAKPAPPVEGQQARVGQNRLGAPLAAFSRDGRMLAYRLDDVTIRDLDRLRQDPVIRASLRLIKLPLLRCDWYINAEDDRVAAFLQSVLEPHMYELLWALCTAFDFGVAFVEKVLEHRRVYRTTRTLATSPAKSEIVLRDVWVLSRVAHLDPSIYWALVYPTGEFAGVRHLVTPFSPEGEIIEEGRLIHFALDAEFNEVYGTPLIKAALPFFELKLRALQDMATYYSTYAVPTKKGYAPPGKTPIGTTESGEPIVVDNLQYLSEQLDKLANAHSIVLPSLYDANGQRMWEVEAFEVPPAVSIESYVQFLDEQMRQAMLVPSLATIHPMRGTYSLGQSQIDLFLQNEDAYLTQIESVLNRQLIPDLVRYNFGSDVNARIVMRIDHAYTKRLVEAFVQQLAMGQPVTTADGDVLMPDWTLIAEDAGVPIRTQAASEMDYLHGIAWQGGRNPNMEPEDEYGGYEDDVERGTNPQDGRTLPYTR
jgi:hypothetical protein